MKKKRNFKSILKKWLCRSIRFHILTSEDDDAEDDDDDHDD